MAEYLFDKLQGLPPKDILDALRHVRLSVIYEMMTATEADTMYDLCEKISLM